MQPFKFGTSSQTLLGTRLIIHAGINGWNAVLFRQYNSMFKGFMALEEITKTLPWASVDIFNDNDSN